MFQSSYFYRPLARSLYGTTDCDTTDSNDMKNFLKILIGAACVGDISGRVGQQEIVVLEKNKLGKIKIGLFPSLKAAVNTV